MARFSPPSLKDAMLTTAPWSLALGFALAAHLGWFCPGHEHGATTRVEVVSADAKTKTIHVKHVRSPRSMQRLLGKVDRASETFVTSHALLDMLFDDPQLVLESGDLYEVERGIRVVDTVRRGVLRRHGLRDNDVITHVMGERVQTVAELAEAARRLRGADKFSISILRYGSPLEKHYVAE